jgi:hypothetical protein
VPPRYEIRLRGRSGPPSVDPFPDVDVSRNGNALLLRGELDQSALHGLLERVRLLRLDLVDVRRSRTRTAPGPGAADRHGRRADRATTAEEIP